MDVSASSAAPVFQQCCGCSSNLISLKTISRVIAAVHALVQLALSPSRVWMLNLPELGAIEPSLLGLSHSLCELQLPGPQHSCTWAPEQESFPACSLQSQQAQMQNCLLAYSECFVLLVRAKQLKIRLKQTIAHSPCAVWAVQSTQNTLLCVAGLRLCLRFPLPFLNASSPSYHYLLLPYQHSAQQKARLWGGRKQPKRKGFLQVGDVNWF